MCRKVNVREGETVGDLGELTVGDLEWDRVCYYMCIKIGVFLSYQVAQKTNRNM